MPTSLEKLQSLLRELFQFELSDLDFGIYRLFRLKKDELDKFINEQIPQAAAKAFGGITAADRSAIVLYYEEVQAQVLEEFGGDSLDKNDELTETARANSGKTALKLIAKYDDALARRREAGDIAVNEDDVFNHLHAFFFRYYDRGDFIARRFFGARPRYAVPYNGEETHFHWANKDQHYIKSGEAFRDYSFTVDDILGGPARARFALTKASLPPGDTKGDRRYFFPQPDESKWDAASRTFTIGFHFRLPVEAELKSAPVEENGAAGENGDAAAANGNGENGKAAKPKKISGDKLQEKLLSDSLDALIAACPEAGLADALRKVVNQEEVARDSKPPVTYLAKRMRHFARRQTSDYFVHKNLAAFLREELDFYIKDQVIHVADLEGDFEGKRRMLRALRELAGQLIAFLHQIEEVQRRLFEKRKFVLRTDYLCPVQNVPRPLWKEICANKRQLAEWVDLYALGKDGAGDDDLFAFKGKLTESFLENHPTLVVNTALFDDDFKWRLLESFDDLDAVTDGVLVKSENYQALRLAEHKMGERVKCTYIDPPYNRGPNDFLYKDRYQHSSWLCLLLPRLEVARRLLCRDGVLFASIDENERAHLERVLNTAFGDNNRVEELVWAQNTTHSQSPAYSTNHEYVEVYSRDKTASFANPTMFREPKPGFAEIQELVQGLNPDYPSIATIEAKIRTLMDKHLEAYKEELADMGLEYDEDTKKQDPWRGIYQYCNAEYRDAAGKLIAETTARKMHASIWVWQSGDASAPAGKQSPTIKDPMDVNFRFYKPLHPVTRKPCPHPKSGWRWPYDWADDKRESYKRYESDDRIVFGNDENNVPRFKRFLHEVETNVAKSVIHDYTDGEKQVANLFGASDVFPNPKPTTLIERFILQTCGKEEWVLDFFGGSGTTAHACLVASARIHERVRFFLSEMGKHFDTVLVPRVQKVGCTPHWKEGRPSYPHSTEEVGTLPRLVKILRLESYEDALHNLATDATLAASQAKAAAFQGALGAENYRLNYIARLPLEANPSMLQTARLDHPFRYSLEILTDDGAEARTVDLVETFNWLLGLDVQRVRRWQHDKRDYFTVMGRDRANKRLLVVWRDTADLDPKVERAFLEKQVAALTKEAPFDRMLINGDSATPGFETLDALFKQLMEAE